MIKQLQKLSMYKFAVIEFAVELIDVVMRIHDVFPQF